jgi:Bacterial regulatory protein, arsR family.
MKNLELEIAKSLFNFQRMKILQAVKTKERTVREIAELLNEKPSRLYYHIHQLEELGLLKVVREEKVGNLIQKYYKSVENDTFPEEFTFAGKLAYENADFLISQLYAYVDDALSKIYADLHNKDGHPASEASVIDLQLSAEEWKELNQKIRDMIHQRKRKGNHTEQDPTFRFILMSYRDDLPNRDEN